VHVAEQRALPAAEAVPRHRHRDRHVDAHHADLMRRANSRAALPSRVKQATPLPNSWSLTSCSASAKSFARTQASTGPKISSR
jgi:hypothetical protein